MNKSSQTVKQHTAMGRRQMKSSSRNVGSRLQTREAYRAILRLIHAGGLQVGDRLPKQSDLLLQLGMCQGTVSAAMRWLVEDGVVERRKCAGTTVCSRVPMNPQRLVWSVGIVMPDAYDTPFFPTLTHFLHKHLALNGCANRVYIISPTAVLYDAVDVRHADEFTGLAEDIEVGMLDAIVTPTRLVAPELPICAAGGPQWSEFGTVIDHPAMVVDACRVLLGHGCRRLGLVLSENPTSARHDCRDTFLSELGKAGIMVPPEDIFFIQPGLVPGRETADRVLARTASERPDGFIFLDDVNAQSFSVRVRDVDNYCPGMAVQTNRQAPLAFALPVFHFDIDVEKLAAEAVAKTVMKLLNPDIPNTIDKVVPELCTEHPVSMSALDS